jgi:hypothetical protein
MVNVNKNELSSQDRSALVDYFDTTLAKIDAKGTSMFLNELLGKEERLTFAKRLTSIILLCEGYSEYKVSRLLKLSPTTTGSISSKIKAGEYDGIIRLLKKKKFGYEELWNTLESILHLGGILPRRVGLDRHRTIGERRATYRSPQNPTRRR